MKQTPLERKITDIIDPVVKDLGFDLVQVRLIGSAKMQTLQILAEDPETGKMDLNGCTAISRAVSAIMDVEDPLPSAYQLEISSPGVDRPLIRAQDFEKHKGFDIIVETDMPQENNQKRFRGILKDFANDTISLTTEDGDVEIAFEDVLKAKLVMSDALVNQGKPKGEKKVLNKKPKTKDHKKVTKDIETLESEEL